MTTLLTLLFPIPGADEQPFNTTYYLETHVPLALGAWSSYGLVKWTIVQLAPESGYVLQTVMVWENAECIGKAMKEKGAEVLGDVKNFSSVGPLVLSGGVVAGGL